MKTWAGIVFSGCGKTTMAHKHCILLFAMDHDKLENSRLNLIFVPNPPSQIQALGYKVLNLTSKCYAIILHVTSANIISILFLYVLCRSSLNVIWINNSLLRIY